MQDKINQLDSWSFMFFKHIRSSRHEVKIDFSSHSDIDRNMFVLESSGGRYDGLSSIESIKIARK